MPKKNEPVAEPVKPTDEDLQRIVAQIREMGELGNRLDRCGLSRRAQIVLLADITDLPMATIKKVLDGLVVLPHVMLKR